jgi:hypothetical protein
MRMSRYAYDYSLTPARPTGWRSVFTSVMTVATIVAVSAISGAVVTLDLLAPPSRPAETASAIAAVNVAQTPAPAPMRAARVVTPRLPDEANVSAVAANTATAAIRDQQPAVAAAAQPATTPQSAPVAPIVTADENISTPVSESALTFASGYALRRAVQAAATAPPTTSEQVARVEAETQFGRAANKVKPKTFARANGAPDRRTADARGDGGVFDRFDRNDKFDFERHQALAFGDQRASRRSAPPQQGGLFSNSPGGLFGGLF